MEGVCQKNSHRERMVVRNGDQQNQCERSAGYFVASDSVPRFDSLKMSVVRFHLAVSLRDVPARVPCIDGQRWRSKAGAACGEFFDSAPGYDGPRLSALFHAADKKSAPYDLRCRWVVAALEQRESLRDFQSTVATPRETNLMRGRRDGQAPGTCLPRPGGKLCFG
jgi:hypothetical protein